MKAAVLVLASAAVAHAGAWEFGGGAHTLAKYDDDRELSSPQSRTREERADFVTELGLDGRGLFQDPRWEVDLALRFRGDLPARRTDGARLYATHELYTGLRLAPTHLLSVSSQIDCFGEPWGTGDGVCRTYRAFAWRLRFADVWHLRMGLEHSDTKHFADKGPTWSGGGSFVELRVRMSESLAAWVRGTAFGYHSALLGDSEEGPEDGGRAVGGGGIEWDPGAGVALLLSGEYQFDDSDAARREPGGRVAPDEMLELDAEFNHHRVRGTALLTWRAGDTWSYGAYGEYTRVDFTGSPARLDHRWMASGWVRMALTDSGLSARLRYLTRRNHSSDDAAEYVNNVVSLGLEQRW